MKAKTLIALSFISAASLQTASAQSITDIFNTAKNAVTSALSGTESKSGSIAGTWVYSGADVEFSSDNVLSNLGGKVASSKIESTINSALTKYGISPSKLSLTFAADSTYTCSYDKRSMKGSYLYSKDKLTLRPTTLSGKGITTDASSGNTLKITCNADKVLTLAQMLGGQVASKSSNTTIALISKLAKNYKGMKVGLKFKKQ